mgnify:FL=1
MRQNWQMWQGVSRETISLIQSEADKESFTDAKIFSGDSKKIRKSNIKWLSGNLQIREILWSFVSQSNRNAFGFDITSMGDIQYTEYDAKYKGHYNWHHDIQWDNTNAYDRKLSITMQLSESDDYEGGDFEFSECETPDNCRKLGTVLVFPSYLQHKVSPVTKGKRKSLVGWFEGPRWR